MYSPLTSSRQQRTIAASSLTIHEHFHITTTPPNVLLEGIEEAVEKVLQIKTKQFQDIDITVFETIGSIGKRCAALCAALQTSDIRNKAELHYAIVDPIFDGMLNLFDFKVSESM